jgi:putative acetyltransferase
MMYRTATEQDYDALGLVMFRSIHEGNSPYTQPERTAWMPKANAGADWADRLRQNHIVLAERETQIVGFLTVDTAGYIDLAYILPSARGKSVFKELLNRITDHVRGMGVTRLTTHASLMAQPVFARHGFAIIRHEIVTRNGEQLRRTAMIKHI